MASNVSILLLLGHCAVACTPAAESPSNDACSETNLASVVAICAERITAVCKAKGQDYDTCEDRVPMQSECEDMIDEACRGRYENPAPGPAQTERDNGN